MNELKQKAELPHNCSAGTALLLTWRFYQSAQY